jgi:hypothetical protein
MRGKTERFEMRVSKTFLRDVDEWRRKQSDLPGRAEAIRRLVNLGLGTVPAKTADSGSDQDAKGARHSARTRRPTKGSAGKV